MERQLRYQVRPTQFIRTWMVSEVQESLWVAPLEAMTIPDYRPGLSTKDSDGKEFVSPAKAHFKEHTSFFSLPCPAVRSMDRIYWPLDTDRVDFSGMWIYPTELRFSASTTILCDERRSQELEIFCCGATRVWCNGREVLTFAPWQSNIERSKRFSVTLEEGANELVVACCDYGERNILLKFGLRNHGETLTCSLPVSVDEEALSSAAVFVAGLHFERLGWDEGELTLRSDIPAPHAILLQIEVDGRQWELSVEQGSSSWPWCTVEQLGIGGHHVTIQAAVSTIPLSSTLFVECYPKSIALPEEASIAGRKALYTSFMLEYGAADSDRSLATLERGGSIDEADIEADLVRVERRGDCADFRAERVAWILARHGRSLAPHLRSRIEAALLDFRYWFDEVGNDAMWFFSENHALAFHTAELIAGQLFPSHTFSNSGMTGLEHQEKAKALLIQWFDKLLRHGYNEWNSANYIPVEIESYLMLLELAEDEAIRALATEALDFTFELFAVMCYRGMLSGASGRVYARDLLGPRVQLANGLTYIAWQAGPPALGTAALLLSLSSYEPPEALESIARHEGSERFEDRRSQGTWGVTTTICKTRDYVLATSSSPREGGPGSQEHLFNAVVGDWRGRFWINHPGELKIFGTRRPGFFTGNALTPKVSPYKSSAMITYRYAENIQRYVEADFTHLIIDLDAFDEVRRSRDTLLCRRQGCWVGIWVANGLEEARFASLAGRELTSDGITNTWYVRIAGEEEIAWEEFCAAFSALTPTEEAGAILIDDWQWGRISYEAMTPVLGPGRWA
jgi:hypothetical protein